MVPKSPRLMLTRKCYRKPRDFIVRKIHFFDIIKIFEDGGLKFINIIVAKFDFKFTLSLPTNQNSRKERQFKNEPKVNCFQISTFERKAAKVTNSVET